VQVRAGCSCAGPYGMKLAEVPLFGLCGFSHKHVMALRDTAIKGGEWIKPGWTRVYFSYILAPEEVDYIIAAVRDAARHGWKLLPQYVMNPATGANLSAWLPSCNAM
jgi:selenocysteine lyase/cysteine desulfurase